MNAQKNRMEHRSKFRLQLDQLLLLNINTSQYVALANSALLGLLLIGSVNPIILSTWFLLVTGAIAARICISWLQRQKNLPLQGSTRNWLDVLATVSGILWGIAPFLLLPDAHKLSNELIIFMIAGMTAGAALSLAPSIRSVIAFNFPAILGLGSYYALSGGIRDYMMCAVLVLYFVATLALAKRSNSVIRKSIINELQTAKHEIELSKKKAALNLEAQSRARQEVEIKNALNRSRRFNKELEAIFTEFIYNRGGSSEATILNLLKRICFALDVHRVSIWLYTDDREAIQCLNLFDVNKGISSEPIRLAVKDYPSYFKAIDTARIVDADYAATDPRTSEFTETYFRSNNIYSLLDAPIFSRDQIRGVICCESVGEIHHWNLDEAAFVASAAQFVSMTMLADDASALASELENALHDARRASATKSAFLANMSHEIRTPMNGVIGAAVSLTDTTLNSKQRNMVQIIHGSSESLMNILNDILDFSKIEAGQIKIEHAPFSISEVINKVASVHGLKARDRNLELVLDMDNTLADTRIGDGYRLGQILHNLVSNAVKFTTEGIIKISVAGNYEKQTAQVCTDMICISVSDTGIGLTSEESRKIFDTFVQADDSTTRLYGGTGLGLSIARDLVQAMDGSIKVTSEKGIGTSFSILLNLPQASSVDLDRHNQSANSILDLEDLPKTILVAEDNETNRLILKALLEPYDIEIKFAENGMEALQSCRVFDFDVVLMDIQMPVMDGEESLRKIRSMEIESAKQPVPIIAVTANAMAHQVKRYAASGFFCHIAKPVRRETLLRELINAHAQNRHYVTGGNLTQSTS